MYLLGAILGAVQIACTLFMIPFESALTNLGAAEARGYMEIMQIVSENIGSIGTYTVIAAAVGVAVNLLLRIMLGIFGDLIYKRRVISTIKEIKQSDDDKQEALRKKGGVSLWLGVLGYWAVGQLPTIIALTSGMLR